MPLNMKYNEVLFIVSQRLFTAWGEKDSRIVRVPSVSCETSPAHRIGSIELSTCIWLSIDPRCLFLCISVPLWETSCPLRTVHLPIP